MNTSSPISLATLQSTANTRQCQNAFFRQQQLKSFHDILRSEAFTIIAAIQKDTPVSKIEASTEFALALGVIRNHYEAIDPPAELKHENLIANWKSSEQRREPWGVVYIEPDLGHTPFYSVVVAVSAAVAAGNCVALKFDSSLQALPSLLRSLLPRALYADNFTVIPCTPPADFRDNVLEVLQHTPISLPTHAQLSSSFGYVIAVVDRTADLSVAARNLVTTRFAFGGTSPYAPDIVLVNEFVKEKFTELVLHHSIHFLTASKSGSMTDTKMNSGPNVEDIGEEWDARIITQGNSGSVIELISNSRKLSTLPAKQSNQIFAISAVTSLDHAIDLISNNGGGPILAAYHFANQKSANYLARFVSAETTFVNHVPSRLLLGPAAPPFRTFDLESRYIVDHFLRPTPAFVMTPTSSEHTFGTQKLADELLKQGLQEIKEKKRKEWMSHGFFEQGIFIGLGLYGVPILTCIGAGLFFAIRTGARYAPSLV